MMSSKITLVILSFVSMIYSNCAEEDPTFTQQIRLNHTVYPVKLKDKTMLSYSKNNNTVITSIEDDFEECEIPGQLPSRRWTLGNGKILAITHIYTNFTILDFKSCTSYSNTFVKSSKPYKYVPEEVEIVIPHYDTFDLFDPYQQNCVPCRYNDRGERIQLNKTLIPDAHFERLGYFIGPITNSSGLQGYFYGYKSLNETTVLQILDSEYNVVKQLTIPGEIRGHSSQYGRLTVCHSDNHHLNCQLFDSDLNSIATARIYSDWDIIYPEISNLETGGALLVMKGVDVYVGRSRSVEVIVYQIQADGTVEAPIPIASSTVDYVNKDLFTSWFTSKNGDYCFLAAFIEKEGEGDSDIKCIKLKTQKKD